MKCRSCRFAGLEPASELDIHLDGPMRGTCVVQSNGRWRKGGCAAYLKDDPRGTEATCPTKAEVDSARYAITARA